MDDSRPVPLSCPDVTDVDVAYVVEVLRGPRLSLGPMLDEFEQFFADFVGTRFAIAVSSGTAGLHLVVKSLGIGPGDGVITTPFSFVASANCLLYEQARPLFVDIDPVTFNIDPAKIREFMEHRCRRDGRSGSWIDLKTGCRVGGILPVHVFGAPCDMTSIGDIAAEYGLSVIEDACEALGAEWEGRRAGSMGSAGVFGFYPNKQITTGEGGMIVTDDEGVAKLCRSYRNQGRDADSGWLDHSRLGYNYRLSDINCALGLAQMERLNEILKKRARVAARYTELLKDVVEAPPMFLNGKRSWFVYVVLIPDTYPGGTRDELLEELIARDIGCNNYFPPIHLQRLYREQFGYKEGDFSVTEAIAARTLALPFHNNLSDADIELVTETLISNLLDDVRRREAL
jgi:perosamine synthetase